VKQIIADRAATDSATRFDARLVGYLDAPSGRHRNRNTPIRRDAGD
jgi:hypothetical protein